MKTAFLASYYADAIAFASTEETRSMLQGACLEPGGIIAATDGCVLFAANAAHDPEAYISSLSVSRIIPTEKGLVRACKPHHRDKSFARYLVIEHSAPDAMRAVFRIVCAPTAQDAISGEIPPEYTWEGAFIDGTFPDWRRVVPTLPANPIAAAPAFNAGYLARFGEVSGSVKQRAAPAAHRSRYVRVIVCSDAGGAAYIDLGRDDAFGVLMPMRAASGWPAAPAWLNPQPAATVEDVAA